MKVCRENPNVDTIGQNNQALYIKTLVRYCRRHYIVIK
jgi:hypothetical protein